MSEAEEMRENESLNDYWVEHSKLICKILSRFPKEREADLLVEMSDRSSVYSFDEKYINRK